MQHNYAPFTTGRCLCHKTLADHTVPVVNCSRLVNKKSSKKNITRHLTLADHTVPVVVCSKIVCSKLVVAVKYGIA
jgi:hypothetical protein